MKKQHITWVFIYIFIDQITKFITNLSTESVMNFRFLVIFSI